MADLEASLEEICDIVAPTRFVLEPTGLAKPSELVDLLRGPRWAQRFDVRPVITLVDPQQDVATSLLRCTSRRTLNTTGRGWVSQIFVMWGTGGSFFQIR